MMRLYTIILVAILSVFLFVKEAMSGAPEVPPLEQVVDWHPLPDRTLVAEFDDVMFRYQILSSKPVSGCQVVVRLPESQNNELRWITQGFNNYQYLTRGTPSFYKELGDGQWLWLSIRTYKERCAGNICLMQ